MEVDDARDSHADAICEVCGSASFEELLCQCSQCNNCYEHVYCMRKFILYIPDAWTCDECFQINGVSGEPMYDTVGEDHEETSAKMDQSDGEFNYEEQGENVTPKVSKAFDNNYLLEELGQDVPKEASGFVENVCHLGEQGMKVAREGSVEASSLSFSEWIGVTAECGASGEIHFDAQSNRVSREDLEGLDSKSEVQVKISSLKASGDIHLEAQNERVSWQVSVMADVDSKSEARVKIASLNASGDIHLNAQNKRVSWEDSVMENVDSKSEARVKIESLKTSVNPGTDPHSDGHCKSLGDAENDLVVHANKLTPRGSGITDHGSDLVDQAMKVLSDSSDAAKSSSHLVELCKIVSPKASGLTNEVSHLLQPVKKIPTKALDVANIESHSEEQGKKAPSKDVTVAISISHSAENGNNVLPKNLSSGKTQTPCNSIDAFANTRAQFKAQKERIALKMRHFEEELHSLQGKIDKARRREKLV
ncbi:unnamed protein product [Rhodiola kirilowii]